MDIIVGTAGHIDHGKTALVKALTGVDADRLPEEKDRGITIDLGFAQLDLGDVRVGFIDVPGHERFIKNMLAGASGVDLAMLVIAADEGVMPQTVEHFEICRLLGIKAGIIVLTKKDLVDEELLEVLKLDIGELVRGSFLEGAPIIPVSSKTGEGIEELKAVIPTAAKRLSKRKDDLVAGLPIDRSFSVKGFGTVVTGTVASGTFHEEDELEILPGGRPVRVRGIQSHGNPVTAVTAGQRGAINLVGVERTDVARGMILAERGRLRPTQIIDAELELLPAPDRPLRSRQRVRVHIGTAEVLARVLVLNFEGEIAPGGKDLVQLRLESPVAAVPGERFIIRSYSPQVTIGGGAIVDSMAAKHRRRDIGPARRFLTSLIESEAGRADRLRMLIETAGERGYSFSDIQARTAWRREVIEDALKECVDRQQIVNAEGRYISRSSFENLRSKTLSEIELQHRREPLAKGILRSTLKEKIFSGLSPSIFKALMSSLERKHEIVSVDDSVKLAQHTLSLSPEESAVKERLGAIYTSSGLEVPKLNDALEEATKGTRISRDAARKIFQLFLNSGELVKVSDEFYFNSAVLDDLRGKIQEFAEESGDRLVDVPKFKDIAGISRKYAIPLLEYFDRMKVTRREGDKRFIL